MIEEAEIEGNTAERRRAEIARIARELAGYGFYVVGALLPDEVCGQPNRARPPEKTHRPA
ncbi:hypothetical protein BrevBR_01235 [Brevundimonas sp. BR2-1]|uniref:hypothetical protein n=1 Tax=Brevundimonas sp. BR2-1 TaxID=3031123 RepID=UPI00309E2A22